MNGNRSVAAVVRGLLLGVCVLAIGSCGPTEKSVEIFFYLDTDSEQDITRLEFIATPTAGDFAGGTGACTLATEIVDTPSEGDVVVENGQLHVDLHNVLRIGPGTIVVVCNFDDGGVEADVNVDMRACTFDVNDVSDAPDDDCPVAFTLESVADCGDGILQGDEECDDGPDNSDTQPNACRENCVEAFCGDGVTDDDNDEECDDEGASATCTADCMDITGS